MYQFVESTGYLLPSTDLFSRWLLREKAPKDLRMCLLAVLTCITGIPKIEVDRALSSAQSVLLDEQKGGWKHGYPVISYSPHDVKSYRPRYA